MAEVHSEKARGAHPPYMAVWGWLLVLTVLEVAVFYFKIYKPFLVTLLIVFALAKASLVALFFMHLRYDKKLLMAIAAVPILLLGILTIALMSEIKFGL